MELPSLPSSASVSPTQEFGKTNKKSVGSNTVTTNHETPSNVHSQTKTQDTLSTKVPQTMKCTLAYSDTRSLVARGTIYLSSEKQTIHGVPVQDDCYRVSVDEVIKGASFLPYETSVHKTVGEPHKSFVAWTKYLVKCDSKVPHTTSTQKNELQKSKL